MVHHRVAISDCRLGLKLAPVTLLNLLTGVFVFGVLVFQPRTVRRALRNSIRVISSQLSTSTQQSSLQPETEMLRVNQ